jgi:hypothetical protein
MVGRRSNAELELSWILSLETALQTFSYVQCGFDKPLEEGMI